MVCTIINHYPTHAQSILSKFVTLYVTNNCHILQTLTRVKTANFINIYSVSKGNGDWRNEICQPALNAIVRDLTITP